MELERLGARVELWSVCTGCVLLNRIVALGVLKLASDCEDEVGPEGMWDTVEALGAEEEVGIGADERMMPRPEAIKGLIPIDETGVLRLEWILWCDESFVVSDTMPKEVAASDVVLWIELFAVWLA